MTGRSKESTRDRSARTAKATASRPPASRHGRTPPGTRLAPGRVYDFTWQSETIAALADGGLWWPARRLLAIADLHLGRSGRLARTRGLLLPPWETPETIERLTVLIDALDPATVVCLGDSFDDDAAARELRKEDRTALLEMATGRRWIWVAGNHDPACPATARSSGERQEPTGDINAGDRPWTARLDRFVSGSIVFRHIASAEAKVTGGEISGHFHPKHRLSSRGVRITRPCFLVSDRRIILPAFGHYTGGLDCCEPPFPDLIGPRAIAILTGTKALPVPVRCPGARIGRNPRSGRGGS